MLHLVRICYKKFLLKMAYFHYTNNYKIQGGEKLWKIMTSKTRVETMSAKKLCKLGSHCEILPAVKHIPDQIIVTVFQTVSICLKNPENEDTEMLRCKHPLNPQKTIGKSNIKTKHMKISFCFKWFCKCFALNFFYYSSLNTE